jgi:hypothetical protein
MARIVPRRDIHCRGEPMTGSDVQLDFWPRPRRPKQSLGTRTYGCVVLIAVVVSLDGLNIILPDEQRELPTNLGLYY